MAADSKPQLKVKKEVIAKAVRALHQVVAKRTANANPLFEGATETMTLLFTLSTIPDKRKMRPVMIPLPNPMYNDKSEVCFLCKDPQKKYKELLLQKHPVPGVTKVIGIDKLRRNYKTIEAKRALADAFDLFLCDHNVAEMMPKLLGTIFYQKKHKVPVPVRLLADPTQNLERAIRGTPMRIPSGPCMGVKIGRCSMSEEELVANAISVIKGVITNVRDNPIQSISVQATDAPALPIWRRLAPPGGAVNLKKEFSDASSSAASDTGHSGASETEGTEYGELPSDAGDTISTRDTVSEPDSSMDTLSELDSEAGDVDVEASTDKANMPLIKGLLGKKRKRGGVSEGLPEDGAQARAEGRGAQDLAEGVAEGGPQGDDAAADEEGEQGQEVSLETGVCACAPREAPPVRRFARRARA
eukprot:CAMPEP_0177373684 /NCGR_PEP_ID=MMETSP0368-20130122/43740_1 /TAXON_ID=447022 ORGANISM="Scrippsiella hangoei-like, Strain SHHI-4" /NCGR_SAMPLE_ID=MMETSP0368 /ASSEMBLY_ACC=CAM_ASM_000363 /LENGTH=414 /DNA_ID=CAMNT_0018837199 /DNA_START=74 /DNA_END=1318 /DNA_ORIENTATION=+